MPETKKVNKVDMKEVKGSGKEKTEGLPSVYKQYEIIVKAKEIEKEFDTSLKKYSNEIKLPGFRKGKVPAEVVRSKYGEGIKEEVIEKLIEKKTMEIIGKEKVNIVSNPRVEKIDHKEGKDLKATVKVELLPTIEIPELEKVVIEIKKDDLKKEKYDEKSQTDAILESNKKKFPVEKREIKKGDQVDLLVQSQFVDTKRMMPKNEIVYNVEDNSDFDISDFYKEIIGKKAGDNFEIIRSYNKSFKKKSWAGKKIKHFVKIKRVFEFVKPELDEKFVKSAGFKDIDSFKTELKKKFDEHANNHKEEKIFNEIKMQITDKIKFDIPESMIVNEVNRTAGQYGELIMSLPEEKRNEYLNSLKHGAEISLKFSLILDEIIKKYKIEVTSDEIEKEFKSISDINNIDIKDVRKYYSSKENRESLKNSILSRKSVDILRKKVKIKEV